MKKLISRFVDSHRAILDMKNKYNFRDFQFKTFNNVFFVTTVMIIVFAGFGLFFNLLEDLHYVFLTENIIILFTYIIYKITKEIQFQHKYYLKYSVLITIAYDVLYMLALISAVNSILFLLLFGKIISMTLIIILLVILVVTSFGLQILIRNHWFMSSYFLETKPHSKLFLSIFIYTVLYICLLYLLNIKMITLAYTVSTLILVVSFFLKQRILNNNINALMIMGIFIACSILVVYMHSNKEADSLTEYDFINEYAKEVNVEFNYTRDNIYSFNTSNILYNYGDYIYVQEDSLLYEYNQDLTLNRTINPGGLNITRYFWDNSKLYGIISLGNESYEVYDLTNIDNVHLVYSFSGDFDFLFQVYWIHFFFYEDELYYTRLNKTDDLDISFNETDDNTNIVSEDTIFVKNEFETIFIKDNYIYTLSNNSSDTYVSFNSLNNSSYKRIFYCNDKILFRDIESGKYVIMDFDDFFYEVEFLNDIDEFEDYYLLDEFYFDGDNLNVIETDFYQIDEFYYDGENYYFDTGIYLVVTDKYLNELHKIQIDDIFFTKNYGITSEIIDAHINLNTEYTTTSMLTSKYYIYTPYSNQYDRTYLVIDPTNIKTGIIGTNEYIDDSVFAAIAAIIYIFPVILPGYKEGEYYG